jgi:hypothetical protein
VDVTISGEHQALAVGLPPLDPAVAVGEVRLGERRDALENGVQAAVAQLG